VYNVIADLCAWGVVDIDFDDVGLASRIGGELRRHDIPAWVEQTTHGYHVWVFPARLVRAETMRRALIAACLAVEYQPKEVFPKQIKATTTNPGNYVRLPLNGAMANPRPRDCRRFLHPNATLGDMDRQRAPGPALAALAQQVTLLRPQAVDISVDTQGGLDVLWDVERIGGAIHAMWRDGPHSGNDRSTTLVRLAHRLREADVDTQLAFNVVRSADQRWGKFHERGEAGTVELVKIVSQAYAKG
jgi:hypothetical protein